MMNEAKQIVLRVDDKKLYASTSLDLRVFNVTNWLRARYGYTQMNYKFGTIDDDFALNQFRVRIRLW